MIDLNVVASSLHADCALPPFFPFLYPLLPISSDSASKSISCRINPFIVSMFSKSVRNRLSNCRFFGTVESSASYSAATLPALMCSGLVETINCDARRIILSTKLKVNLQRRIFQATSFSPLTQRAVSSQSAAFRSPLRPPTLARMHPSVCYFSLPELLCWTIA